VIVGLFSFLVNLLLLTGPLYMLEPICDYFTQALREY
jgi:ABC-type protease/lipase transport system fused ATPase/permease subunit